MTAAQFGFAVRPGQPGDAERIAAAFVETWRATYPGMLPDRVLIRMSDEAQAFYWSRLLSARRPREFVYVAVTATNALAGFGSAGPGRDGGPLRGEIYTLYVRPDWQNRGVGRGLLCALFRGLRERGCRQAMLWVLAANPSRFFYEAMGGQKSFERTERLWGMDVAQIGYRWRDLATVFKDGGPCKQRTEDR
jgi:ribosomal protein S18 acetylase RimI-like enzyme